MTALVTGGGGFLGRYIVEQLVARGDRVRVLARGDYPELAPLGVEQVRGDVRDSTAVQKACEGIDTVFHTAAIPGVWGDWKLFHGINTAGTENVIAACRRAGVCKLIYTSSPSVVFDGRSHHDADESLPYPKEFLCHYPHSKALAEQAVLAANGDGLCTVSLRPHLLWGPRDNHLIPRLIARAKAGRLRRVGTGRNLISMSYVENAAAAHVQVAEALETNSRVCGQVYFINEPEPVNLWEWIDRLLSVAGLPPVRKQISAGNARRAGRVMEAIWMLGRFQGEPPMTRFVAAQLSQSHTYSVESARRDFGYRPVVTVDEGLRRLVPELQALAGLA